MKKHDVATEQHSAVPGPVWGREPGHVDGFMGALPGLGFEKPKKIRDVDPDEDVLLSH